MALPVSNVVSVNILSSPIFPARQGFGLLCIFGVSPALPLGERIRFYSSIENVAVDFSSTTEEYKAANIFFSQSPTPTQLAIARRFTATQGGQLIGGINVSQKLTDYTSVTNGGFDIQIDGVNRQVTALNLSTVANMAAVAAAIQTKLVALAAGTTCVWDGKRFIITSGTAGTSSSVAFVTAPTGSGTPSDVSALLALRLVDKGSSVSGIAGETLTQSLDAVQQVNQSWYGFTLTSEATEQDFKDAMAWAEARVKIFGYTTAANNVKDATQVSDIASVAKSAKYRRTFGIWDNNDSYAAVSAIARAFAVNFNQQNSTLTLKFKTLPGNSPCNITETDRKAITEKNINYYSYFGTSAMLAEGVMADGTFFDEVHGLDWLQNAIQNNVFGHLYSRTTKMPQTDAGVLALVQQVELALESAVKNGLLAPGFWTGGPIGQINTGDFLPRGYYVYASSIASQSTADRQGRKAPPIQIIAKGSGAIHFVDISVTFER